MREAAAGFRDRRRSDAAIAEALQSLAIGLSEVLERQGRLEAEIQTLRAVVERQSSRLTRTDIRRLRAILPATAGVLGSEPFTSNDLTSHDSPAIRLVIRGLSSKSVGRLLSRAELRPVDGYVVRFEGMQDNVKQWSIHRTLNEVL